MKPQDVNKDNLFSEQVEIKERCKLMAQREKKRSVWFGLGMFGLVGWSVAVPSLLVVTLGVWLDKNYPTSFSWTMTFLIIGLFIGCLNAWYWVIKEDKEMHQDKKQKDE